MDALRPGEGTRYAIGFGGEYTERWSEDYTLCVEYSGRRFVTGVLRGGEWRAEEGDASLCEALRAAAEDALVLRYFRAALTVYAASQECLRRGLPLTRLYEFFSCGDGIAAPELLRLLMDDCGFKLESAWAVTARCCTLCALSPDEIEALAALQPRTARLAAMAVEKHASLLAVEHDGSRALYRDPPRALRCGERVTISFRLLSGTVESATLILFGDRLRRELEMDRTAEGFSARFDAPMKAEALWYSMRLKTPEGERFLCPNETGCDGELYDTEHGGFRFTVYRADFETPAWFRRAVMYQVFPDRFAFSDDGTAERGLAYHLSLGQTCELHKSLDEPPRWQARAFENGYSPDDFYGGTLRGIETKLPYLKELGISCLYLNPIVEARSNHRYDTADYERVDPILGTNEDFAHLAKAAEDMGIRIILDGVFSHTGADSVYFNRYGSYPSLGACQGRGSPYYKWYDFRRFPDDYRCWWGFKDLPEVDECEPSWQEKIVTGEDSVVRQWLRRGASGWRLDVADELPDSVLQLIRRAAKEEKPDAPIIGEVWEDAVVKESYGGRRNYALGYSLDSVMNYPFRSAALDFAHGRIDARALRDFLRAQRMNYPEPMYYCLMNLLGSHDMERLKTALATDITVKSLPRAEQLKLRFDEASLERALRLEKLCAALQFSIPGVPSVYYGDEQGMEGVGDPFNRMPFREGDRELHEYYVNVSALRGSDAIFAEGEAEFLALSADALAVVRFRGEQKSASDSVFLTVINRGGEEEFCVDLACASLAPRRVSVGACSAVTVKAK